MELILFVQTREIIISKSVEETSECPNSSLSHRTGCTYITHMHQVQVPEKESRLSCQNGLATRNIPRERVNPTPISHSMYVR